MVLKSPNKFDKGKTIVYLIRHGDRLQIEEGKDAGLGIPGSGLSKLGIKQAKGIAKKLGAMKEEIDVFGSSRMARAIETAVEIGKVIKKKPRIYPGLEEFHAIAYSRKIYLPKFWKHYGRHKLSVKVFNKILNENKGKVIVLVVHGHVISGIIANKMGLSLARVKFLFHHNNCNFSILRFNGTKLEHIHCVNSRIFPQPNKN